MRYLITGGCGFLGSNIAKTLLENGFTPLLFDNLSRVGSSANLDWLKTSQVLNFVHGDIRNRVDVDQVIKRFQPDIVIHLAGQVAMTTSISSPYYDFQVNALGTINLLEAIREYCPSAGIVYSSTNKVYGDLEWIEYLEDDNRYTPKNFYNGFGEDLPINFQSPYGCSKGAADQYLSDYSRIYGLKTVVLRHSSMYGGRQFPTDDQGWIGWFCQKAINQKRGLQDKFYISGNGKQVRDVLHCDDMVNLYIKISKNISALSGEVFNIGGGIANSLSLLELFALLEDRLNIKLAYDITSQRISDQKYFVADIRKINKFIQWNPKINFNHGINMMLEWVSKI